MNATKPYVLREPIVAELARRESLHRSMQASRFKRGRLIAASYSRVRANAYAALKRFVLARRAQEVPVAPQLVKEPEPAMAS